MFQEDSCKARRARLLFIALAEDIAPRSENKSGARLALTTQKTKMLKVL